MFVDVNIPRFNQSVIAALTGLGFLVQSPELVLVALAILAVSYAGGPRWAPLTRVFVGLIRPRLHSEIVTEPAAPPRFSQLLGTVVLGLAAVALLLGATSIGWTLVLVVFVLSTLAATTRICVGCIIYTKVVAR